MPAAASADPDEVQRAARAEHGDAERSDELERDRDAERDAVERRVERAVHPGEREPEHGQARARGGVARAAAGRQISHSTTAANSSRRKTVPPGPISSNSVFASAAPNCTDATAPMTSTGAARGPGRSRTRPPRYLGGDNPPWPHGVTAPARRPPASAPTRSSSGSSPASTRRSRSWTSTRCGRTRARCSRRAAARRSGSRASRCAAARCSAPMLDRDPGFRGLMTFTLPESLWLHGHGFDDLLLAYPTADRDGARRARRGSTRSGRRS